MKERFSKPVGGMIALFAGLLIFTCSGIWSVPVYANQDGMPHLYNAFLIGELVRGNEAVSQFAALNPAMIPNLTGHWILAALLLLFSPAAATKIFVTFLLGGLAFAAFFLRLQVVGRQDYPTAMFLSFVIAFNWMWFLGFYNFILGAIGFGLTLGFWWRWRENLNPAKSLIIILLLLFVFFSHLISFVILAGTLGFLSLTNWRAPYFKRTFVWTLVSILLTLPFFFNYLILSRSNAGLSPSWGFLENPFSPSSWFLHLRSADPFQLISRKAVPFVEASSGLFAVFSPSLWLIVALVCLAAATFLWLKKSEPAAKRNCLIWGALFILQAFLWIAAPNDFGKSHGGFLRERVLLLALICFVPFFLPGKNAFLKIAANACLVFILIFQTLVVFNYAREANDVANEVLEARNYIGEGESFGSIVLNRESCKFKPIPRSNLTPFIAIGKSTRVLDNYELGYYLFPVIARDADDRQFIYEFRESNTFDFCDPSTQFEPKFERLSKLLESRHEKIDVLLVWGDDERIDALVSRWFENAPFYQNKYVRLFRRRGKSV